MFSVDTSSVSPAYDVIELLPLAIFQLSWSCITVTLVELPDFEPNEYLFTTHADKGNDRWEIFAWAVRSVIAEAGGLRLNTVPHRVKMVYEGYM